MEEELNVFWFCFGFFFCFLIFCFFERECEQGSGRGRGRESQAGFMPSMELDMGLNNAELNPMTVRSRPKPKSDT